MDDRRKNKGRITDRKDYDYENPKPIRVTPYEYRSGTETTIEELRTYYSLEENEKRFQSASAEYVKTLRKKLGLSVIDFAELCGVEPQTVYQWQWGTRRPTRMEL